MILSVGGECAVIADGENGGGRQHEAQRGLNDGTVAAQGDAGHAKGFTGGREGQGLPRQEAGKGMFLAEIETGRHADVADGDCRSLGPHAKGGIIPGA